MARKLKKSVTEACANASAKVESIILAVSEDDAGELRPFVSGLQSGSITLDSAVHLRGVLCRIDSRAEASGHLRLTESEVMAAIGAVNDVIEALTGKPWAKSVPKAQGGEK